MAFETKVSADLLSIGDQGMFNEAACGELFVVDALRYRPQNPFQVEGFDTVRAWVVDDVDVRDDAIEVFRDYGPVANVDFLYEASPYAGVPQDAESGVAQ